MYQACVSRKYTHMGGELCVLPVSNTNETGVFPTVIRRIHHRIVTIVSYCQPE